MEEIYDLFLKEHYSTCLDRLEELPSSTDLESSYLLENNKIVCKILIALATRESVPITLDALLLLHDNYLIALKHSNRKLHFDLQLSFMLNIHWYALSNLENLSKNNHVWDLLLNKVSEFGDEVSIGITMLECSDNDFITNLLSKLLSIYENNLKNSRLLLELCICTVLIIMITQCDCDEKVYTFSTRILQQKCNAIALVSKKPILDKSKCPFKLSYFKPHDLINDIECLFSWIEIFQFLKSPRLLRMKNLTHQCLTMEYCTSLRNYCIALKNYESQNYNVALSNLLDGLSMMCPVQLLYHYRCLLGQVYSIMKEKNKAVEQFSLATTLLKNRPNAHYYLGREYGSMGLYEKMLNSFKNLIMSYKKTEPSSWSENPLIDRILESLHGASISKGAAIYVLAVAYGINEMFDDASVAFYKLLNLRNLCSIVNNEEKSIIVLPHISTIYHESSAINLLTGNLTEAEDMCRRALSIYPDTGSTQVKEDHNTNLHGTKDIEWIKDVLENELGTNIETESKQNWYYEDYLSFFDEDVIGMLLLAELQRIQDLSEGRVTLNQALLLLSKYIARSQKEPDQSDRIILVKALTSKTCLQIAKLQISTKTFPEVDKMFKRALSCNNGDKDVLFHYASYLISSDKINDAEKLWNTFYGKESIIQIDKTQSLALRYLLRTQVSQRQIENLALKFL